MENVDLNLAIALAAAAFVALLLVILALRWERARTELTNHIAQLAEHQQSAQSQLAQRLIDQERFMAERLDKVGQQVGNSLQQNTEKTHETLAKLRERLAVMDEAQKNITELSTQMVGLQDILSNKQARGAFGEIQLKDLVESMLPPDTYSFQATVGDGRRVDCLIKLPNPPGPIGVDAKFPLESYQRLQTAENDADARAAAKRFADDIKAHVVAIAEKYIVPGQTSELAIMFLPSEAVYAELHARHTNLVEEAFKRRVVIVSPSTMWATLNTVRAIFRDVRMREQAGLIQKELHTMLEDVVRLDKRVGNLEQHFNLARRDVEEIRTSATKVTRRAERIQELELEEDETPSLPDSSGPQLAAGGGESG